jgi:phage terminase large subunit
VAGGVLDRYLARAIERERKRRAAPVIGGQLDLAALTFPEQRAFVDDESSAVLALCGRRAGKSSAVRIRAVASALRSPGTITVIISQTRVATKKLYWQSLQRLLRDLGIPFASNATELTIRLPNDSQIWLAGAKDATEVERLRGHAFAEAIIDEAQSVREGVIRSLVEDVLTYALVDYQGRLVLTGTPPLVPIGWFVERFRGQDARGRAVTGWSKHHWTVHANTKLDAPAVTAFLDSLRKERGLSEQSATWRREVLGELVLDADSLVLSAFDLTHSVYTPDQLPQGRPTVVLGIDVGWQDADAVVALGRFPASNDLYVVEEYVANHKTEEQLAEVVRGFIDRHQPVAKVIDTGGNAKTAAGIARRLGTDLIPANKPGVVVQFQRVNDEFRARRLRVPAGGHCAGDAVRMAWAPGRIGQEVADEPHSDAIPALAYALSESSRYFRPELQPQPRRITPREEAERARVAAYLANDPSLRSAS